MRFNRGETEALRDIYALYKDDLVTLAAALLYNKTTAEDVVHDVFAKLIQHQTRLRITRNLRQYLMTAVANTARQYYHSQRRAQGVPAELKTAETGDRQPPESGLLFDEQNNSLPRPWRPCPTKARGHPAAALQRAEVQADRALHDVSINTIQGRYRYGLDKLRSLLNGELP